MKTFRNIVTDGLSGRIKQLVFRQWQGQTVVASAPSPSNIPATADQLEIQQTFKEAVIYAKAILTDAAAKLAYKAKAKRGQSAFNVALRDFFKPPVIESIDKSSYTAQAGSFLSAQVTDDFQVASVEVRIENAGGQLIEAGTATLQEDGLHYRYTTTATVANIAGNRITFIATDMPGHLVTKQTTI